MTIAAHGCVIGLFPCFVSAVFRGRPPGISCTRCIAPQRTTDSTCSQCRDTFFRSVTVSPALVFQPSPITLARNRLCRRRTGGIPSRRAVFQTAWLEVFRRPGLRLQGRTPIRMHCIHNVSWFSPVGDVKRLPVFRQHFEMRLWMVACRTVLRRLSAFMDVPAVAAPPHKLFRLS